jgi:cytochrome oxidase assembly protein ShyY1
VSARGEATDTDGLPQPPSRPRGSWWRSLKFLFRPSWIALVVGVLAFAFACFSLLSPWQFGRNAEREAQNNAIEASLSASPRPLNVVLPPGVAPSPATEWSRVTMTGTYLPEGEVVARLRTVQGEPAFEVLTPLRTLDGQAVLVDRGYVRQGDHAGMLPYAAPPGGVVQVEARIRQDETDPKNRDVFTDPSTSAKPQSYVVDSRVVARASGLPIRPGYFQLDENQPGVLAALPLPRVDAGPFLSYALQWIAFGVMAIAGLAYFTVRELRPGGVLAELGDRDNPRRRRAPRKTVAQMLAEDEEEDGADEVSETGEARARPPAGPNPPRSASRSPGKAPPRE